MAIVHTTITTWRLLRNVLRIAGKTLESTLGIVSPTTTQKAHIPPNANTNWNSETATG